MNFDINATIEDSNFDVRQVGAEPLELMADLHSWAIAKMNIFSKYRIDHK